MGHTWLTIEQAGVTLGLSVRTVNRHINAGKLQSRLFEGRREVLVSIPDGANTVGGSDMKFVSSDTGTSKSHVVTDGRHDVVEEADDPVEPSINSSEPGATPHQRVSVTQTYDGSSPHPSRLDPQTVLALTDSIEHKAELAITAYQTLARTTEARVHALQRSTKWAWSSVAVMTVAMIAAVGWTTYRLTRDEVTKQDLQHKNEDLHGQIASLTSAADRTLSHINALETQINTTRIESAKAEGRVQGMSDAVRLAGLIVPGATTLPATQPADLTSRPSMAVASPTTQNASANAGSPND